MAKSKNDGGYWIGFDLGGTKMFATVFDDKFNALGRKRKKTKGYEGQKAGVARIISTIEEALEEAEVSPKQLNGIGVGCPGPLDLDRGVILEAPNLGWKKVKLREELEDAFGAHTIIGNDVDIGLYGEYRFGAAKKARCVVGLFPGTGIGGGCIYEGQILRGASSSCMEIGHNPVQPAGPYSGISRKGSLEAVASRLAIASAAAAAAYRGDAPHLLSIAGTDIQNIRSGVIAESIEHGDTAVEDIVKQAGGWMGTALVSAVHLLAPEVILLGGGLIEAMPELLPKEIKRSLNTQLMPSFQDTYELRTAKLGDDAGVTGAAAWAQKNFQ